ncbi:MAG TPA: hypothetical protein VGS04_00855 [Nitrososphaerales archaeon]|nr:hypothetical protein [Nitrososphaerales archaeon]
MAPLDEDSTDELELVDVVELAKLAAVLRRGLLVDDLVDSVEFKTLLDPTPSPMTITTTITMTATDLVEIPFAASLVATHLQKMLQRGYF